MSRGAWPRSSHRGWGLKSPQELFDTFASAGARKGLRLSQVQRSQHPWGVHLVPWSGTPEPPNTPRLSWHSPAREGGDAARPRGGADPEGPANPRTRPPGARAGPGNRAEPGAEQRPADPALPRPVQPIPRPARSRSGQRWPRCGPGGRGAMGPPEEARARLARCGQSHLLRFWAELGPAQRGALLAALPPGLGEHCRLAAAAGARQRGPPERLDGRMEPLPAWLLGSARRSGPAALERWEAEGERARGRPSARGGLWGAAG